jgi:CheY-like chemotaxis protein
VLPVRVLIVDDQEPFRRAASAVVGLTDGFVVVDAVDSGESCLAAVPRLRPDLVLMDLALPGIDGIETTRRLGGLGVAPVVVLLTTYDEAEFGEPARAAGAAAYLDKAGFGPEALAVAWSSHGSHGSTARSSTSPSA